MARAGSTALLVLALLGAAVALFWPQIEQQLAAQGVGCPWPVTKFLAHDSAANGGQPFPKETSAAANAAASENAAALDEDAVLPLRPYSLEELKACVAGCWLLTSRLGVAD